MSCVYFRMNLKQCRMSKTAMTKRAMLTNPIRNCLTRLEMQAYLTSRGNMHFAVVKRASTTSETPVILLLIHFFCTTGLMQLY